ncbi:MAG: M13 family peptidase, partial [Hymenobacter sp.]|nr:M13 family peptidase [Hymenobacter sp.]
MKNNNSLRLSAVVLAGLTLAACSTSGPKARPAATTIKPDTSVPAGAASAAPTEAPSVPGVGLSLANIDQSASACQDFNQYASGNWYKNNPIPAAEVRWGSFNELSDKNNAVMRQILREAAANPSAAKGTNAQKVGDFYASAMDTVAIEQAGLKYLQPELSRIQAIKDLKGVQAEIVRQQMAGTGAFFNGGVGQDDKNSTQYAVQISQGGLSLPDRDYYLKDDSRSKNIRAAYTTYLTNTFRLLGESPAAAAKNAATVIRLETRLAKASKSRVDLRDPYANYNKLTVAAANQQFPNLGLPAALQAMKLGAAKDIIVGQPAFFKEESAMLKQEPLADLKIYMRWHMVSSLTAALPKAYGDEAFRFAQVLTGAKQQQPRWKRMNRATDGALGEAFGQLYVDKAFTPETKAKALEMVANIREAMADHIRRVDWMSDATKQEALKKLNAFTVKIGYPDKWKDYSALTISRESYLKNV